MMLKALLKLKIIILKLLNLTEISRNSTNNLFKVKQIDLKIKVNF